MTINKLAMCAFLAVTTPAYLGANGSTLSPDMTPERILEITDKVRGGGMPGLQWTLRIESEDTDAGSNVREMIVRVAGDDSVAETTYPPRAAGGKLLQLGRNMWYGRPDLSKAVSISSRQKLIGPAANGDIASTNYAKDYDAVLLREDQYQGEEIYVLGLTAKSRFVTYDRIEYWVSKQALLPVRADFFTVSGKLFKIAYFEIDNQVIIDDQPQPFVSRMTIHDVLSTENISVLDYHDIKLANVTRHELNVAALTR